jgi:MoaA/NifB/PqqE/SkfB family radical SAM enzyme
VSRWIPGADARKQIKEGGYLLKYYLGTLVGKKRPLLGGIKLTHRCNLSCAHCPFRRRKAPSLTWPQVISSLSALYDRGVRILIVEGGEPFLWRDGAYDLDDVVAEARKRFFTVGVTTNGTFPIETGADIVWISIDGLESTHDRIRGQSFGRIMANLEASSHPRIYAHITINALNWVEVPELVAYLSHRVKGITVQFHYPYQELDRDLYLPFDKRRAILSELIDLKRQGLPLANSYACLEALKDNRWKCRPWMIASVDPDGTVTHGCYLQGRGEIACERCGFSAHTEISLAYGGAIESILVGNRIFFSHA